MKKNGSDKKFKIAILLNEPENPSGHKHSSKDAKKIADAINAFATTSNVEVTYVTDGGEQNYVQDYLDLEKVNLIAFESHSKSR